MEAFKVVGLLCSFALVAMVFAANVRADPFDKKTVTTFSEPFEVQGLDAQILPATFPAQLRRDSLDMSPSQAIGIHFAGSRACPPQRRNHFDRARWFLLLPRGLD